MRFAVPSSPRSFRWYVPLVCLFALGSSVSARAQACTTTITGTVYTPNGLDPLPNVLVYVPSPGTTPAAFVDGVGGGCTAQLDLVPKNLIVDTTTDYMGNFTLTSPNLANATEIVIQSGKWRRQIPVTVTQCQTLALPANVAVMPKNKTEGDIPKIAVVTGGVDAAECVLRKLGVQDAEFTNADGTGRINFFSGASGPGASITDGFTVKTESALITGTAPVINGYDMVMYPCQGNSSNPLTSTQQNQDNLVNYANNGGRVFATHWSEVWLDDNTAFASVANWNNSFPAISSGTQLYQATIDQSYAEGKILADWLTYVGASTTPGKIGLSDLKRNITGVNPPTQSWATLDQYSGSNFTGNPVMQFTFDTPIAAAAAPTLAIGFTNTPATFLQGSTGDTVVVNITNSGNTAADTTLKLTLTLPQGITVTNLVPTSGTGWACTLSSLSCTRNTPLAINASDSVTATISVDINTPVGNTGVVNAALIGGGLSGTSQCGRVLYNEYHVEEPATGSGSRVFPGECGTDTTLTPQEKFLEFSLFNLSNFVAPTNTDSLIVQGASTITWTPANPVYYGTPVDDPSIADATSSIPGQFSYTVDTTASPIPVGPHMVTLTFTPTDTTDYISSTKTTSVTWVADPTVSTIDLLDTSIFYGEEIGFNNGVDAILDVKVLTPPGYPIGITAGLYTATIDGKDVCHGIEGQPLNPPSGRCDDADFLGWNAGDHKVLLTYAGDGVDFLPSVSPTYIVHISPDPTVTTMSSSANPSLNLQPITLSANVADVYTAPVGPVTFYDSTTPHAACAEPATPCNYTATVIGSVPVNNNAATLTLTTLFHGTHYVSACFTPPLNSDGVISNFYVSCSASVEQVVTLGPTSPLPTQTLLTTSINPSLVGQLVTFTATINTTGAFPYIPTGTVSFFDGTTLLGKSTLTTAGIATYGTNALALGSHPITAVYGGSTLLAGSTSAVLTQIVTTPLAQAGTGFLLNVDTTTAQVPIGSSGVVQVQIIELNNFNQPIKLTCSGLPAQSTCTFATPDIPASGGTTQLSITAAAPHDCNSNAPYFVTPSGLPLFGLATLTLCIARRRRKLQGLALLTMLCLAPTLLTGCGAGNCTDFGVKPNNYTFSITATSQGNPQVVKVQKMTMNAHL